MHTLSTTPGPWYRQSRWLGPILALFYGVGVLGLAWEPSRFLFQHLVPLNLIQTTAFLLLGYRQVTTRLLSILALIFVLAWGVECVGVNTGLIFGHYTYDWALGWELLNTPLIIGLNWIILLAGSRQWVDSWQVPAYAKPILGAVLMTVLDGLIEPVAIRLEFWHWDAVLHEGIPPVQNFLGWFVTSALLHVLYGRLEEKTNQVASWILVLQFLFFGSLNLVFLIDNVK